TKDSATISKMQAKFFNAVLEATGKVTGLQAEPVVDFKMKSNAISLEPWNELVPMLKDYSLTGSASFDAAANGPTAKLQYGADIAVKDLKAKAPMLKVEPVMNAVVKIATDKIEKLNV